MVTGPNIRQYHFYGLVCSQIIANNSSSIPWLHLVYRARSSHPSRLAKIPLQETFEASVVRIKSNPKRVDRPKRVVLSMPFLVVRKSETLQTMLPTNMWSEVWVIRCWTNTDCYSYQGVMSNNDNVWIYNKMCFNSVWQENMIYKSCLLFPLNAKFFFRTIWCDLFIDYALCIIGNVG